MSYSNKALSYDEGDLLKIAEMYFVEKRSQDEIAKMLNVPRAKIVAMCKAAEDGNLVKVGIVPSSTASISRVARTAAKIREKYNLLDCVLVESRREIVTSDSYNQDLKFVVLCDIAREAAKVISERFIAEKDPCLAVSYGLSARLIVDSLPMVEYGQQRGIVVPIQGVRAVFMDRFGANDIARDFARHFGSHYYCLPIPGLMDLEAFEHLTGKRVTEQSIEATLYKLFPDYDKVYKTIKSTNIALVGLGSVHYYENAILNSSNLISTYPNTDKQNLFWLDKDALDEIRNKGAIGNLCGSWFDKDAIRVQRPDNKIVLGLTISEIKGISERDKPVILAAGCDVFRIPALHVLLKNRICNIWVGDETTARVLLNELKIGDVLYESMSPSEKEIMNEITNQ